MHPRYILRSSSVHPPRTFCAPGMHLGCSLHAPWTHLVCTCPASAVYLGCARRPTAVQLPLVLLVTALLGMCTKQEPRRNQRSASAGLFWAIACPPYVHSAGRQRNKHSVEGATHRSRAASCNSIECIGLGARPVGERA
eukprot:gene18863-biopygen16006